MPEKAKKKLSPEDLILFYKAKRKCGLIISNWTKIVAEIIMSCITDEIQRFKKIDDIKSFDHANFNVKSEKNRL